ncbi:MAG TPA: flagellar type III secretion system pore protein FliP [Syntrophorhabdales bacterium]|nr:flagellar type III secretion system pore protein FliP [Syntrophorhabdales bacterium]
MRLLAISLMLLLLLPSVAFFPGSAGAKTATAEKTPAKVDLISMFSGGEGNKNLVNLALIFTVLSFAPAILLLMTSFTRIVIVLSFLRQAIGTPTLPPTQVIVGLSLFLTFFIMGPTFERIHVNALSPYMSNKIAYDDFIDKSSKEMGTFMFKFAKEKDVALFANMAGLARPKNEGDIPFRVLVPAFAISELKRAFQIGFLLYVPFLIIDMVVASVLLSTGMMMLPPIFISLPFKLMLFVLVDGWNLLVGSLVKGFM